MPGNRALMWLSLTSLGMPLLIAFTPHLFAFVTATARYSVKWLPVSFFSREKLAEMYSSIPADASFLRGHQIPVTVGHMLWSCMSISEAFSYSCKKTKPPQYNCNVSYLWHSLYCCYSFVEWDTWISQVFKKRKRHWNWARYWIKFPTAPEAAAL